MVSFAQVFDPFPNQFLYLNRFRLISPNCFSFYRNCFGHMSSQSHAIICFLTNWIQLSISLTLIHLLKNPAQLLTNSPKLRTQLHHPVQFWLASLYVHLLLPVIQLRFRFFRRISGIFRQISGIFCSSFLSGRFLVNSIL